jgi:hypothetical protein
LLLFLSNASLLSIHPSLIIQLICMSEFGHSILH